MGGVFNFRYNVERVTFYGFSGYDPCGRKNVAISNEMAADGEGSTWSGSAHFGKSTCYPVVVKKTNFSHTPNYARLRFSEGRTTDDVQFGLCTVYDDGSLLGYTPEDATSNNQGLFQLVSNTRHEWPSEVLTDCSTWEYLDYTEEEVGGGSCLWWIQFYDTLKHPISTDSRRGVVRTGIEGTGYSRLAYINAK